MFWIEILVFILLCSFAYAAHRGAPWVPTWRRDFSRIKRLLDLKEGETFFELGCGDGRVVCALSDVSGAKGIGVELSFVQYLVARLRAWRRPLVCIELKDAFNVDLSEVDAVYLFLMSETYGKLCEKFEKELKPGCRVVTYVWPIPGWVATEVDRKGGRPPVYLYRR
ncbi:methyltransferase domain-containing protein [Candidatus Uhrbacteria bacterium]|nr:methyltransferase domain-containing protein [Candidatus Uhrbacteria bacterium]